MDNLIGKKLDGLYEVKELIGAGGMANVYKAVMLGRNGPVLSLIHISVSAAVNEAVKLTRSFKKTSASGLVNAVLRRACTYDLDTAVFRDDICLLYTSRCV